MSKKNNNHNSIEDDGELTKRQKIMGIIGIALLLCLSLYSRLTNNKKEEPVKETIKEPQQQQEQKITKTIFDKIDEGNYSITFKIDDNGNIENGMLKYNLSKVILIINNKEIYRGDIANINYKYYKYLNLSKLKKIISLSIKKSTKEDLYNYDVSAIDLFDIYSQDYQYDSFLEYTDDKMDIYMQNGYITKVMLDYSNYYKYINKNNSNLSIEIEYGDIGAIGDI